MSEKKPELPPEVEDKLSELEIAHKTLEQAKKKSVEYYDQLLRMKAEFENFRKRVEKEKAESIAWGKQEVLLKMVSLLDVFEQALIQAHSAVDLKDVVEGVEMLHKSFSQFLKAEGLQPVDILGKPLDPRVAEVIEQQEVEEALVGHVLSEIQKGYVFQGRILRPSLVRVGVARKAEKGKTPKHQAEEAAQEPDTSTKAEEPGEPDEATE